MAQEAWPTGDAQYASTTVDENYIVVDTNGVAEVVDTTNKTEPPTEVKEGGILHAEPFWRQYYNWTLDHYASIINIAKDNIDDLVSRTLTAGSGLTGGGDNTADRTINIGEGQGINVTTDAIALDINSLATTAFQESADFIPFYDVTGTAQGKAKIGDIVLSATTALAGKVELLTQTELNTGVDTTRSPTASILKTQRTLTPLATNISTNGVITLSSDWDTFEEIVIDAAGVTGSDTLRRQDTFYTSIVDASDSTSVYNYQVTNFGTRFTLNFRDTNKDELYVGSIGDDDKIVAVYGRYPTS